MPKEIFNEDVEVLGNLKLAGVTDEIGDVLTINPTGDVRRRTLVEFLADLNITASDVSYNNTNSLLDAINVQDALDELRTLIPLVPNGVIWANYYWQSDYNYFVGYVQWAYLGIIKEYIFNEVMVLDPSDLLYDRIDWIVLNAITELLEIVPGIPSVSPAPEVLEPHQLPIAFVVVFAASTDPGATDENIYLENVEWTSSVFGNVNADSLVQPQAGLKSIAFTAASTGHYVDLDNGADISVANASSLRLGVYLPSGGGNRPSFNIVASDSLGTIGTTLVIDGQYGFQRNLRDVWQVLVIPAADLGLTNLLKSIRIVSGQFTSTYYIDNIILQYGVIPPGGGSYVPTGGYLGTGADLYNLILNHTHPWSDITSTPTTLAGYGITGTKAQFNTALTDGDFLFVGDVVSFPGFTSLFVDYGFTDNSANWNTAFSWGDHAGLYLPIGTQLAQTKALVPGEALVSYDAVTGLFTSAPAGGGASLDADVNQVAHGLVVGDAIYHNGSIFAKAQANDPDTSGVLGIVSEVADVDNFTYQYGGLFTPGSWTIGTDYFLSVTTAGAVVIEPTYVADNNEVRVYIGTGVPGGLLLAIDIGNEIITFNPGDLFRSEFNAHTILAATLDNTPLPLTVGTQTLVGRITGGNIAALTPAQVRTMLNVADGADVTNSTTVNAAGAVMESDYDAQTILAAILDNTPLPVTIGEEELVGRLTGGNIKGVTKTEVHTYVLDRVLENLTVTTTQTLDYQAYDTFNFVMTGATVFSESNLPTSGVNGKVILINMTGNFAPTYPAGWSTNITGIYDGTVNNVFTVWYIKSGVYKVTIIQPD